MIITRAPLRISLAGGGTDLPSYFLGKGTSWIAGAINKYCYTMINDRFSEGHLLKYSISEECKEIGDIKHELIRETLKFLPPKNYLEITFTADLPGGTGLGSSGSFLVSLLHALHAHRKETVSAVQLAEEATEIEMKLLKKPIGLQDQYISSIGGITEFEVNPLGKLTFTALPLSSHETQNLENRLGLFFTGQTRLSSSILQNQVDRTIMQDQEMIQDLESVTKDYVKIKECIMKQDISKLGDFFDLHWKRKRIRVAGMTNPNLDKIYDRAVEHYAYGGKLIGAGGGGFMIFATDKKKLLSETLKELGIEEISYRFVDDGATLLYRH